MVKVERLNGKVLYLNYLQIESMECIPETKIRMMNGDFFLVKDKPEDVCMQMERLQSNRTIGIEKRENS